MKISKHLRSFAAFALILCLWATPMIVLAGDKGEKNFKQGMKYEEAQQWDKAAEEFALAVAAKPSNTEYRLHYQRALFNASQMMMTRGRTLAEQKDFVGAYNTFRQAYGYDPVNELAKSEMDRMLRLQREAAEGRPQTRDKNTPDASPNAIPNIVNGVKVVPISYTANGASPSSVPQIPQELEELRNIKFNENDLKNVIKDLADGLDLNVLFDTQTFRQQRKITLDLKNVTTAQALDAIFLQEGLFFQKVGRRMILVADQQTRRGQFQQLVLRTFYLANAKPADVQKVLTQAIPPQPNRPPTSAIVDESTNSLTVRDTSENMKLIANLVKSLDKDRAEVVMDVNIYEVSKSDLLRFGNQLGTESSLTNLGGTTAGKVGVGANGENFGRSVASGVVNSIPGSIAAGILLPAAQLQAFQSKSNTRLLASTQVHAFNNEESQARIGQRVPVQTAQVFGGFNGNTGTGGQQGGNNPFGGNGFPVINYEQVGLTLKFTPIVFPNQDVQVKMSIESKDVLGGGLTPTFTERSISGTARIQNNRTMMLASVAQDNQSSGRQGLPLLGLIPILGRLFTAPVKDNRQTDIVIAVTPRVLRAPAILPEDEQEQPTGSIAVPTNSSLADMITRENLEDQLAAARRLTNNVLVQVPDAPAETTAAAAPGYVPAAGAPMQNPPAATNPTLNQVSAPATKNKSNETLPTVEPKPIDTTVKTLTVSPTVDDEKAKDATPPKF